MSGRYPLSLAPGALPESWRKEDFSIAYAHAVASVVGVACDHTGRDINGWDVKFAAKDTEAEDAMVLNAQLKCTTSRLRRLEGDREVSFQLGVVDYDNLRKLPAHPPRMLIVVEPDHDTEWLGGDPSQLIMHASAWYMTLAGMDPLPAGQDSTSVRIPIEQRFTPSALLANMCSCP